MKCFGLCVEKNVMACLHTMSKCEGLYGQWLSSRLLFDLFYLQQRENETKLKKKLDEVYEHIMYKWQFHFSIFFVFGS